MAMADRKRPTERTPKSGIEVPVPKRGEFFSNLKKIAGKSGKDSTTSAKR